MADFKVRWNPYSATADATGFTVPLMVTWDICETSVVSIGIATSFEELQCNLTFLNWPISTNASKTPSTNYESNKS
jgi:hypothetical protein